MAGLNMEICLVLRATFISPRFGFVCIFFSYYAFVFVSSHDFPLVKLTAATTSNADKL